MSALKAFCPGFIYERRFFTRAVVSGNSLLKALGEIGGTLRAVRTDISQFLYGLVEGGLNSNGKSLRIPTIIIRCLA